MPQICCRAPPGHLRSAGSDTPAPQLPRPIACMPAFGGGCGCRHDGTCPRQMEADGAVRRWMGHSASSCDLQRRCSQRKGLGLALDELGCRGHYCTRPHLAVPPERWVLREARSNRTARVSARTVQIRRPAGVHASCCPCRDSTGRRAGPLVRVGRLADALSIPLRGRSCRGAFPNAGACQRGRGRVARPSAWSGRGTEGCG